ncbi:MAG: hypothetical protein HXS47_00570 [Theionarchaea archaeon]|nr:hypothetical protein [Theionarchaea archaeon]
MLHPTGSFFDPRKIFDFLIKVLMIILGIILISIFIFYLTRGEYKGIFLLLFMILATLVLFRVYWSSVESPSTPDIPSEHEITGDLETVANMVFRASCDLEYSREKLEDILSDITGEDITLQGTGETYVKAVKKLLDGA